jgi:hypothetical protein
MLTMHVAVVSQSANVGPRQLMSVSAALQKQVTRDFGPIWGIQATVSPFASLEDVPLGYWPIVIMDNIKDAGADGVHEDRMGQPFALVKAGPLWSLAASHECLEMLADPSGSRTVGGYAPRQLPAKGKEKTRVVKYPVEFLLEVCDPCEDAACAYPIDDIPVSDFYTPHYFDTNLTSARYDFTGWIKEPREIVKNGYLSWYDPGMRQWYQHTYFSDVQMIAPLPDKANKMTREKIDRHTPNRLEEIIYGGKANQSELLDELPDYCSQVMCASSKEVLIRSLSAGRILADRGKSEVNPKVLEGAEEFEVGRANDAEDMKNDINHENAV